MNGNKEVYTSARGNNGGLFQHHQHQQKHRIQTVAGESKHDVDYGSGPDHQYAYSNVPMGMEEGNVMG